MCFADSRLVVYMNPLALQYLYSFCTILPPLYLKSSTFIFSSNHTIHTTTPTTNDSNIKLHHANRTTKEEARGELHCPQQCPCISNSLSAHAIHCTRSTTTPQL
jgi:hypothetical protein